MKKILITLIALITLSIYANAQRTSGTHRKLNTLERKVPKKHEIKRDGIKRHRLRIKARRHRHHRMVQQLNLSDNQKQQAKVYKENNRKQLQELNKNETITVKEFRDRKLALHKEQQAKKESILTPEQKNKMGQIKAEHKAKAGQHYAARMDKMKSKLSLTDDQVAKMKTQRTEMMTKMTAIKQDNKMDRIVKKEKLLALKEQMKEENKKIFTPDQLNKMEKMKKERMEKKTIE